MRYAPLKVYVIQRCTSLGLNYPYWQPGGLGRPVSPCVDVLKIDGEFVRGLREDRINQHLVRAIVRLAHAMGKKTVAECVEDEATLKLLKSYGVDYAQGSYVGEP